MSVSSDLHTVCESFESLTLQSASEIASELLSELLTNVCNRDNSPAQGNSGVSSQSLPSAAVVDVCGIVRRHTPSHVLCGYCERETGWEVLQLRCVDQKASGYCGHYSLYLAILFLELSQSSDRDTALALLERTRSTVGFWRRYWVSIGLLLKWVQAHPDTLWWPWTEHHVLQGEMERSYLSYLLTSDPCITAVGGSHRISVIHFAYGCIQNPTGDVIRLQQTIEQLRASGHPFPGHVFILGVTNHWVTLYAYHCSKSVGQQGGHTMRGSMGLSLIYMDSNNVAVLGASDKQIDDIVVEKEKKRVEMKGQGYTSWKRGVIRQALRDQRDLVSLLASCLSGQQTLPQHVLCWQWRSVLDSFEQNMTSALTEVDMFLPLLLQWLENHHRPHSLRDLQVCMLQDIGAGYLSDALKVRLAGWLHYCRERLADYHGGIELVDVFVSVLEQLGQFLGGIQ